MTNEDFRAVVPGIRVSGGGKVDLGQQAIDYEVVAAVQKGKKADNVGLGEISGEKIPVRIKGPLDDPSIRPDLTAVIGDQVRDTVLDVLGLDDKDKKKKKNQDGEEEEGGDLKKRLENLIGG
jgi:AsmA protein